MANRTKKWSRKGRKTIMLTDDQLYFRFLGIHMIANLRIEFQRTLRIPDDNREHYLPPGLGRFPLMRVDDYSDNLPERWNEHGGVFFPMYQSEAMWINFRGEYPMAIKIAAGKINAITGKPLERRTQRGAAGLPRDSGTAVARRVLRTEGLNSPVRGDDVG